MAVRRDYIAGLYRDMLGREGSDGEISGWENAPDEQSVYNMFAGSPEYAARTGGQATWQDVGGVITPSQPAPQQQQQQSIAPDYHGYTDPGPDNPGFPGGGSVIPEPGYSTGGGTRTLTSGGNLQQQIAEFYKKYLGRDALAGDADKWLSGAYGWGDANNLAGIERGIQMSDEAARNRAANPTTSYSTAPYTGFATSGNDYSAFNTARPQDPGKSAKDRFVQVTNQAPPPPTSRALMPNWFNTYIRPGFEAAGNKILSVDGDSFTYSNHEGTFRVDYFQNADGNGSQGPMRLQWGATPADAATAARYAGSGTAVSGGNAVPTGTTRSSLQSLGQYFGGPGGPGITNGPLQQMGDDPFSQLITGAISDLILRGGSTAYGDSLKSLMSELMQGGGSGNKRYESSRELADKARRTSINDSRAMLADRGLLSEPGAPSGVEGQLMKSIAATADQEWARTVRDIAADQDDRILPVLQIATNLSQQEAATMLAAIGEGTNRQTALAQIALAQLGQNMAWNQFLAEFGLKRDQALQMLSNGQTDDVMQLMNMFLSMGSLLRGGYV